MTVTEITEAIAALSLAEARALVDALRARLDLAAPVDLEALRWANPGVMYGAPPWLRDATEDIVVLEAGGSDRLKVIATLRTLLALTPAEAKAALDRVPVEFGPFDDVNRAWGIASALAAVGAVARIRQVR